MYKYTETDLWACCPGRGTIVVYSPHLSKVFITCLIEATHLIWQAARSLFFQWVLSWALLCLVYVVPFISIFPLQ